MSGIKFEVFTSNAPEYIGIEEGNNRHAKVEKLVNEFLLKRAVKIIHVMMTDTGGYSTSKNFTVGIFYVEEEQKQ